MDSMVTKKYGNKTKQTLLKFIFFQACTKLKQKKFCQG